MSPAFKDLLNAWLLLDTTGAEVYERLLTRIEQGKPRLKRTLTQEQPSSKEKSMGLAEDAEYFPSLSFHANPPKVFLKRDREEFDTPSVRAPTGMSGLAVWH